MRVAWAVAVAVASAVAVGVAVAGAAPRTARADVLPLESDGAASSSPSRAPLPTRPGQPPGHPGPAPGHPEPAPAPTPGHAGAGSGADATRSPITIDEEVVEVVAPAPPGPEPDERDPRAGSAFVTVLEPGPRGGAGRDLATLLGQAAGVRTSSLGGLDTFSTVSLRGSSGSQVLVLLDGVPLTSPATGSADLASLPLEGLERIEVYRGQVPALLGGQAIGGAVNLVSRTPDRPGTIRSARLGYGSFGTWDAALGQAGGTMRLRYRLALSLRRTAGDFPFHDDNGTPLDAGDDGEVRRVNNDVARLGLLGRIAWRMGNWRLAAFADGGRREAGVPGPGSNQAEHVRLDGTHGLLDLVASRQGPVELQARSYLIVQRNRFSDPDGELQRLGSGPSASDSRSWALGGRLGAGFDLSVVRLELGGDVRQEQLDSTSAGGPAAAAVLGDGERSRLTAALGLEPTLRLFGGVFQVGPALRIEHLRSRLSGGADGSAVDQTLLSPRAGLQWKAGPWTLKANAGIYHRAPTFFELFGGQGGLWGNPELQPEEGTNLDLGLLLALETYGPFSGLGLEAAVFQRQVRQMITWMQTSQEMIQAANLGEARLRGLELSLQTGLPWGFSGRAAYALLDPENRSPAPAYRGRQLPLRPVHDLDLGLAWSSAGSGAASSLLTMQYGLTFVSGTFLDPANLHPLPPRHLHSASLWLRPWRQRGPQLLVEVRNLLDRRVEELPLTRRGADDPAQVPAAIADFAGYPLPGRSLFASVLWTAESER